MRHLVRCLVLGLLAAAALRQFGVWTVVEHPPRLGAHSLWSAMSFALAAVVEPDRGA